MKWSVNVGRKEGNGSADSIRSLVSEHFLKLVTRRLSFPLLYAFLFLSLFLFSSLFFFHSPSGRSQKASIVASVPVNSGLFQLLFNLPLHRASSISPPDYIVSLRGYTGCSGNTRSIHCDGPSFTLFRPVSCLTPPSKEFKPALQLRKFFNNSRETVLILKPNGSFYIHHGTCFE